MVSSAVRLYYGKYLTDVADQPGFIFENPVEATYIANSATLWSQIECSTSIITACLPTLVPVATKFRVASQAMWSWTKVLSRGSVSGGSGSGTGAGSHTRLPRTEKTAGDSLHSVNDYDSGSGTEMTGRIQVNNTFTISSV